MSEPAAPAPVDAIMASIRAAMTAPTPSLPVLELADPIAPDAPATPATPQATASGSLTLEHFARAILEPHLKAWLDANLPELVQREVIAAVERLTTRG